MQQIGQADFACCEIGRYAEYLAGGSTEHSYYRTCWVMRCYREINGVLLEQNSGVKYSETGSGEGFTPPSGGSGMPGGGGR